MCNLSDSIEERGIQKGTAKCLAALVDNLSISLDEVMKMLEIDPSECEIYKQLVEQLQTESKE